MAEKTSIAWTRSTRNIWTGCTKVGPGCDHCYAESFQRFVRGKDLESGEAKNWGPGRPRIPHLEGAFKDLQKWNQKAAAEANAGIAWKGRVGFWPVFLNSESDFFDNEVAQAWRDAAYPVIESCRNLTFLLVTKRIGNVERMVPERWFGSHFGGLQAGGFPDNVRLLITVCNQEEADRDIPKLLALPCKNGVSYEPALGGVDWSRWLAIRRSTGMSEWVPDGARNLLQWIIVGGESTQGAGKARPFVLGWGKDTIRQCRAAGVPVFFKQAGSNATNREGVPHPFKHRAGADPAEWPEDLRIMEFPE